MRCFFCIHSRFINRYLTLPSKRQTDHGKPTFPHSNPPTHTWDTKFQPQNHNTNTSPLGTATSNRRTQRAVRPIRREVLISVSFAEAETSPLQLKPWDTNFEDTTGRDRRALARATARRELKDSAGPVFWPKWVCP